jgi:hypothetical protein
MINEVVRETIFVSDEVKDRKCDVMAASNGEKVYCISKVLDFGPLKGAIKFAIPESSLLSKIEIEVVKDEDYDSRDFRAPTSTGKMNPDKVLSNNMKSNSKKLTSSSKRRQA